MDFAGDLTDRPFHKLDYYFFGAFLVYTGAQMFAGAKPRLSLQNNVVGPVVSRFVRLRPALRTPKILHPGRRKRVGNFCWVVLIVC